MAIKTPLGRVLGLGSAKDGTGHWWMQRVTAVALVPLALWLTVSLLTLDGLDHATVIAWIARPVNGIGLILLLGAAVYHSLLGTQVVIEDYVKGGTKVATLVLVRFVHIVVLVSAAFAVLKIAFGTPA